MSDTDRLSAGLTPVIARLLQNAGASPEFTAVRRAGGANNRAWRIDASGGPWLLKEYFHHPQDRRDRLQAEFSFLAFAWVRGVRTVPQPLACDPDRRLALMEFIEGRMIESHEATTERIEEAAQFFRDLNRHRACPEAATLSPGAEACFSIGEHRAAVAGRVERLRHIRIEKEVDREAAAFVARQLRPEWERVDAELQQAEETGQSGNRPLEPIDRCLSPSDFGFHNAILEPAGRLRFHDFEYAGWDDPARMICDFFLQPHRPVPLAHWMSFAEVACAGFPRMDTILDRARLLFPLYRIKWCYLLLNEFLDASAERRAFSGRTVTEAVKARQLALARDTLRNAS